MPPIPLNDTSWEEENMTDEPLKTSMDVSSDDRLLAALAWIPFFWPIISILLLLFPEQRGRPFVRYHVVLSLLTGLAAYILTVVCVGAFIFLAMFYGAYLAYQGKTFEVPLLSEFARNQEWV
jgi:uncharacterized membrane protein